jgi:hypothetical protein
VLAAVAQILVGVALVLVAAPAVAAPATSIIDVRDRGWSNLR